MIDPATNFLELHSTPEMKSFRAAPKVDSQWLCLYPRPLNVMFDNGSEFLRNKNVRNSSNYMEFLKVIVGDICHAAV